MRALKTITQPINEAVIVRPEVSFMQAMKALGKIIISLPGCTRYIHPESYTSKQRATIQKFT